MPEIGPHNCEHGMSWRKDDVSFTTLQARRLTTDNDLSCTLLIETTEQVAYLSGDISTRAKKRLLVHLPANVSLLLAPHHGSKTSSSMPFVRHVLPRFVFHSAGRSNRYGHPHRHVARRFVWERSQQFITGVNSAIQGFSHRPGRFVTNRP